MSRSWFSRLRRNSSKTRSERRLRQRGYKPVLEAVEERVVPCTISWKDPVNGDWGVAANWRDTSGVNRLPGTTDYVCILRAGVYTVTHSTGNTSIRRLESAKPIDLSGGMLTLNTPLTISVVDASLQIRGGATLSVVGNLYALAEMSLNNGTVTGPGDVTAQLLLNWVRGTMSGSGTTRVLVGAGLVFQGDDDKHLDGRTLEHHGQGTWTGAGQIGFLSNARFNITRSARFEVQTNAGMRGTSGVIVNDGLFWKHSVAGETVIEPAFHNTHEILVQGSRLTLRGNGNHTGSTSQFYVYSGATLQFMGGIHTLNAGARVGVEANSAVEFRTNVTFESAASLTTLPGSAVRIEGGSVTFNGIVRLGGRLEVLNSPTITFTNRITTNSIRQVVQGGGTIRIETGASVTTENVDASYRLGSGALLTGPGNLIVNGRFYWGGGGMSGTGETLVNGGMTIENPNLKTLDRRTLSLGAGLSPWLEGDVVMSNSALIKNLLGSTFESRGSHHIRGNGTFSNAGIFRKDSPATTGVGVVFNQTVTGQTEVLRGTISLYGGGTSNRPFTVAAGAILHFNGGNYTLGPGTTVTGPGTVYVWIGTVTVNTNLPSVSDLEVQGDPMGSGTLFLGSGFTLTTQRFRMYGAGSVVTGPGNLTVTGPLIWSGGTMRGPGTTIIAPGATLNIPGTETKTLDGRTLENRGTAIWSSSGNVQFANGGRINNLAGATFESQDGAQMLGNGTFNNAGTFRRNGQGNTAGFLIAVNQNAGGRTEVLSGNLAFNGGSTTSGPYTIHVAANASMSFYVGTHTLGAGTTVTGAGTVFVSLGTLQVNANVSIPLLVVEVDTPTSGTVSIAAGANLTVHILFHYGTVTGPGQLTITGSLRWFQGTMRGPGTTVVIGDINLLGSAIKRLDGRTIENRGTVLWRDDGEFRFDNNPVFNNHADAVFEIQVDTFLSNAGTFNNAGFFRKVAGTGTLRVEAAFNNMNTGTVEVRTGTLRLASRFDNAGTTLVQNGSLLIPQGGGTHTGAMTLGLGATLGVTAAYTIGGGLLTGAGAVTVSGRLTWTGGAMSGTGTTTVAAGGILDISSTNDKTLDTRSLVINSGGIVNWLFGGRLLTDRGSTITNNGTFHVQGDATLRSTTGTGSLFTNAGTFRKSANDGVTSILIPFTNTSTGTLNVERGTVDFGDTLLGVGTVMGGGNLLITRTMDWIGGTWRGTGTTTVASSGTLNIRGIATKTLEGRRLVNNGRVNWLDSGTLDAVANARIENANAFVIQNAAQLGRRDGTPATFTNTGTVTKSSASVTQVFNNVTFNSGTTLILNNGTLNLEGPGNLSGSVTGAGHLDIAGTVAWTGGTMTGPGQTIVSGQGTLNITGSAEKRLDRRPLENRNRINWLDGNLLLKEGVVISNIGGAEFNAENNGRLVFDGVINSRFSNAGIFRKRTGAGITTIDNRVEFRGNGTIEVWTGMLDIVEPLLDNMVGTELRNVTLLVRGTLKFTGANIQTNRANLTLDGTGSGIVNSTGGNALERFTTNLGTFTVRGNRVYVTPTDLFTNAGTMELREQGTLTMGNLVRTVTGGFFNWHGGILGGTGDLQIDANGRLNILGGDPKELRDRRILVAGTVDTSSIGGVLLGKGSQLQIQTGGRLEIRSILFFIIGGGTLSNRGTIQKLGPSEATFEGVQLLMEQGGRLEVDEGTLRLLGGLSSYDAGTGTLNGGIYRLTGVLQVPGADLRKNGASMTLVGGNGDQLQDLAGTPALANLDENLPGSTLQLLNGAYLSLAGGFTNAGIVTIGGFAALETAGPFIQTVPAASLNLVGGDLVSLLGVELQAGMLSGSGTIRGDVLNRAALVRAGGAGTGLLSIDGSYLQESGGTLELQVKNLAEFDVFAVTGFAQLAGTLNITKLEGFSAQPGDSFRLLECPFLVLEESLQILIDDQAQFELTQDELGLLLTFWGSE